MACRRRQNVGIEKRLTEVSQSITNKKLGQRQQHRPYKNFRF